MYIGLMQKWCKVSLLWSVHGTCASALHVHVWLLVRRAILPTVTLAWISCIVGTRLLYIAVMSDAFSGNIDEEVRIKS